MTEQIIEILEKLTDRDGIESRTDLFEEDILDSLAFIELLFELETTFGVEIQPTQIPGDTWQTPERIAEMVESLMKNG